jgi:hypothetical protein
MSTIDLHKNALALFAKLKSTRKSVQNYNDRRREMTASVKRILMEMDTRMKAGEKFAGYGNFKDYCRAYRSQGCFSYQRIRQIITGTTGNEARKKKSHPSTIKRGIRGYINEQGDLQLTFDGVTYTVIGHSKHILDAMPSRDHTHSCVLFMNKVEEKKEEPAEISKPKIKKLTAAETAEAVRSTLNKLRSMTSDEYYAAGGDGTLNWVLSKFDEAIAAHPEWRDQQIQVERKKLTRESKPAEIPATKKARGNAPRRPGRSREKTPNGIRRIKGTHSLLNETVTHCGIYYSDAPRAQFYNICDIDIENPTCRACKCHKEKLGIKPAVAKQPGISEPAKALAAAVDGASTPKNIAPEILDALKRQKLRISVGADPHNDGCPDDEEIL